MDKPNTEKELKTCISTKLQQIRRANGYSIEKMAETLSLDYSVFYHILNGTYLPRLTTLWQISKIYNIPLADWFGNVTFEQKTVSDKKSLEFSVLHNFRKLDNPTKVLVAKIIRRFTSKKTKANNMRNRQTVRG
jgi:transcriptional regulator with XRE-family HTH domain